MSNIVRFDSVRTLGFASIGATYTPLGDPFDHAMRVLHFINDTNGTFMVSFDGINDNVPMLAESFSLYDLTSDQDVNEKFRYQQGTQLFVKYLIAPTLVADSSNSFYCVAIFGKGE
jgi:hypothetical protein